MESITKKSNAKINIGLDVVGKLDNGYHLVKMIMQTLTLHDVLTFTKSNENKIMIDTNCKEIPCDENNLIYKAAQMLIGDLDSGVEIYLEKNIPVAAGLAGGSGNAAATFIAINELFELGYTKEELMKMAVKIGADVPYCIMGGTALSEGIGEVLTPLKTKINPYVLIAKPNINVSTKFVYENLDLKKVYAHPDIDKLRTALENNDYYNMTDSMGNILENVTIARYPVIDDIKEMMIEEGAYVSLMSGSGPTVFGFFRSQEELDKAYNIISKDDRVYQIHKARFEE